MTHGEGERVGVGPERGPEGLRLGWVFLLSLVVAAAVLFYLVLTSGPRIFGGVSANLPLLLPLAVTLLSIMTRATEIRSIDGVLRMSNDLAIGILSFDIWAISVWRTDPQGRILVNQSTMINGDFAIPLLVIGLVVTVWCVVLTHYPFRGEVGKRRWLLATFIGTVLVYVAPFGIRQPAGLADGAPRTVQLAHYVVAIPYADPAITKVAPAFRAGRWFMRMDDSVEAQNLVDARSVALQRFLSSASSNQVRAKNGEKVVVDQSGILVCPKTGDATSGSVRP